MIYVNSGFRSNKDEHKGTADCPKVRFMPSQPTLGPDMYDETPVTFPCKDSLVNIKSIHQIKASTFME